jgi:hypothetical protein
VSYYSVTSKFCNKSCKQRVFKTKRFAKDAHKEGVSDTELCRVALELGEGKGEDLGGNVWKKRLNENRNRSIVATKPGAFWIFVYLFAKNARKNINVDELATFKKLARDYGSAGQAGVNALVLALTLKEICHDKPYDT